MSFKLRLTLLRERNLYIGPDYSEPLPRLPLDPRFLVEDTDYGVVKVQDGKLVFDMPEFDADLGEF